MAFIIKQHDLRPYLSGQIQKPDKTGMDLTLATEGNIIMRKDGEDVPLFRRPIVFLDRENGEIEYAWQDGDTDDPGEYNVEIEIMWGTEPQTFPPDDYYKVVIVDDLDNP